MHQTIDAGAFARDAAPAGWRAAIADDKAMLRAARDLTKDLGEARAALYWPDMTGSALLGYAALAGTVLATNTIIAVFYGVVAALAFYRALMFIHELTHIHRDALPGFRLAWNLLVGIPLLTPSFMYEGVHTLHHKRTQYGTAEDPEYLPLALMKPWSLPLFVAIALLAPAALLFRFAVLAPLGVLVPAVRKAVWERASSLSINPAFRRRAPDGEMKARVRWQEVGGTLWAWGLLASTQLIGWRPLLVVLAVVSVTAVLNQLRTLVAHLWENEGEPTSVTAQFLDSVNVPPPGRIAEIWAPVGLRYHALHHLMPSLPYHSLPEAHRRLVRELGTGSTYHGANHPAMLVLVSRIAKSTMGWRGSRGKGRPDGAAFPSRLASSAVGLHRGGRAFGADARIDVAAVDLEAGAVGAGGDGGGCVIRGHGGAGRGDDRFGRGRGCHDAVVAGGGSAFRHRVGSLGRAVAAGQRERGERGKGMFHRKVSHCERCAKDARSL